ncbi:hypothetical protein Ddc_17057 [Ditylenchus destructor]|nr:hypothetical protein Ddc_17057 [Ditylenchus destructor]
MGLKKCDEYQIVESIKCEISYTFADIPQYANAIEVLKRDYAQFVMPSRFLSYPEEERDEDDDTIDETFEFVNEDIGKKLHLSVIIFDDEEFIPRIRLRIENL